MEVLALLSLTMAVAMCVSGSESTQARGFDENPWMSMNQQPEVLIVKEKGGSPPAAAASSGMKMKDLTPIICLLAPLLLAAIMLPAKMTMMMNGMMSNTNGMMMMPNGMVMLMPGGPPRLTELLMSGMTGSNKPLGLPIFKTFLESKKFSEDISSEDHNDTNISSSFTRDTVNTTERNKVNKDDGWYVASSTLNKSSAKSKIQKNNKLYRKNKGDTDKDEWSSRVWPTEKFGNTLAEEILKLFENISNFI